jgi:hypothetical protein
MSTPNPTITSKNLPPTQHPSGLPPRPPASVEVALPYSQIEAKPLRAPSFVNLRHKNPNMSIYLGNRAVGEKESGLRYDQLIAMGFIPAKPEEVETIPMDGKPALPCPPSIVRDGRIMYGDLILLKIPREDYVGALKWNEQNARLRVKRPGVSIEGDTQGSDGRIQPQNTLADLENNARLKGKIKSYVPALAEVDSKTADNSGPVNLAEK